MAGVMKLACLVLACMIVAGPITSNATLACTTVNNNVLSCFGYLTQGGPLPVKCCTDIGNLKKLAGTTPDRQAACRCLQAAAKALGSRLNAGRAAGLPKACKVSVPFPISASTNCNSVS
ncbi:hypothetical protein AALP_AA4G164000 [Arabis alpina]|uniref:Non-specific lipid-transfer protein n=1 Tax=Arabis alpina TaxID=50452 RepID=A0A087H3P2_ARAAL|nr:hypothetical protein AALP_AA4G164000 [Arabis alpina]